MGRRARNKKVLLALVKPLQQEPETETNDDITSQPDPNHLETEEGEIIVDKGKFYLIREGDQFVCMERGNQRDITDAIFDNLEDALFHMRNEH